MAELPEIESRFQRFVAYLKHNSGRIVVDVALLATWIVVAVVLFEYIDYHDWLLYVIIFVGVALYTRFTPTWERPYRSTDEPETPQR